MAESEEQLKPKMLHVFKPHLGGCVHKKCLLHRKCISRSTISWNPVGCRECKQMGATSTSVESPFAVAVAKAIFQLRDDNNLPTDGNVDLPMRRCSRDDSQEAINESISMSVKESERFCLGYCIIQERMVMTFRVSELQMLLGYAGKNKTGRKNELQSRALDIVRLRNPTIQQKIKELYKSIQLEMMSFGDRGQGNPGGAPGAMIPGQRVPSGLASMPSNYSQPGNLAGNLGVTVNSSGYSSRSSGAQVSPALSGYTSIQASHNAYPISPDVKLKKLPFYDILGELLKPSTLAPHGSGRYQEATFNFSLTPQQANKIAHSRDLRPGKQDYTVQVQMRFCLLETTCEQEDNFPPNITVKINDKMCPLPSPIPTNKQGVEPKRPPRPVNVTALCKISPTVSNRILVSWSSDYGRCYVISVYLVQKLTSDDLLQRLKSKGPRLADFTRSLIKQKLREDGECEIATTSLRCSLLCPLGKMRMVLPCRAETCNHLQCFDASLFLQMNERKPTWTCPVCDKVAVYDTLVIDGYFQEVLTDNSSCSEVTLHKDGDWTPLIVKKEQKEPQVEKRKSEVAVETLIDDSDDSDTEIPNKVESVNDDSVIEEVPKKRKNPDVEIITLSDSEDDSAPPSKRTAFESSTSPSHPSNSPSHNSTSNSTSTITSSSNSSGTGSCSNDASGCGRTDGDAPENAPGSGVECTKSNDSWCVGEVDPGKRLIFRKSLSSSSSNSGGLVMPSNNCVVPLATSPGSSGSGSPQVICLDSPASSPSPPPRRNHMVDPIPNISANPSPSLPASSPSALSTAASFASPTTSCGSPALSTTNVPSSQSPQPISASVAASLASLGSELMPLNARDCPQMSVSPSLAPVTITPVPLPIQSEATMPMAPSVSGNPYDLLQDPFSLNPLATGGLPNIFNPIAMMNQNIAPPTSSPDWDPYRQDRYL